MVNMIPESTITEIRNAADIVDIISDVVMLRKAGRNYQALCPFHSEKTPSFTVSPEKQMFYCFGCGAGGDVFTFLKKYEGLSFTEAARTLAKRYGINIPEKELSYTEQLEIRERENLLDINLKAADFFHRILVKSQTGRPALNYLIKRGINQETINDFNLGYAPKGWNNLLNFFSKKGIKTDLLLKSGLIVQSKNNRSFYDRFRERIIFPITDIRSQVVGFGGRVMDNSLPKYLNSPETKIFNKSRILYGLNRSKTKLRENGFIYLVEGYIDFLALWQKGIKNAAATMGTSLSSSHVRLFKSYANNVILVFDSDAAGIKAATRSLDVFRQEDADAKILILPRGHDPDSFIREFGKEAFEKESDKATGMMEFLMDSAIKRHGLSVEGKIRIISQLKGTLASIKDPVSRSLYIRELSERIGVDEAMIMEKVREIPVGAGNRGSYPKTYKLSGPATKNYVQDPVSHAPRMETKIISMMLQFPHIIQEIRSRNILSFFENDVLRAIGRTILAESGYGEKSREPVKNFMEKLDDTGRKVAARLSMTSEVWEYEGCKRILDQFQAKKDKSNTNILQQIEAAKRDNNHSLLLELLKQKQDMARNRQFKI